VHNAAQLTRVVFWNPSLLQAALEDTYVTIFYADGEEWMRKLIANLSINGEKDVPSETSALLNGNNHLV
jgi:hypothetical protein